MTSYHLLPVLENEGDSELLCRVASLLSVEQVLEAILEAIRLGRMTALSKLDREGEVGSAGLSLETSCGVSGKDDREASH